MDQKLTQAELDERILILKRFRTLLEQQRTKFQEYLKVLEAQESKISEEDAEALLAHSELETEIVANITSLQKVIVPMEALYNKTKAATYNPVEAVPISRIQADLTKLQSQVLAQNEKNRTLLKSHMSTLRQQIQEFQNPYRSITSVYTKTATTGSRIQVEV
ncbi:flagellar export chaperone FlgN [Treponema sp.]|uniref:flagellar export chaperone FlgN n=1 Tax=Treponema sp. TaxID=166 RepID=UPI00298D9CEE|nr:flagellar export chaperone FlgN [Treponema sp.]MCQ2240692.1 flagellar export chaperone FlgN [Treponema sp.]